MNDDETELNDQIPVMDICFEDVLTRETVNVIQEADSASEAALDKQTMATVDTVFDDVVVIRYQHFPTAQLMEDDAAPISIENSLGEQRNKPECEDIRGLKKLSHF